MPYIPAKMIERLLSQKGINVDGYAIIQSIDVDMMEAAEENGMKNGITEEFDFKSVYELKDSKLTFEVSMVEDYKMVSKNGEVPYYYSRLNSCSLEKDGIEQSFCMEDIYWD